MYNLSFILATRNRLPFLKITLEKLLAEILPDEEIVVVDGNSTDGTKEYLQELYESGKIHQFISEPDKNQAHGWNKAMLLATGTIIKKIIDDDVFCYSAIRECKKYLLANNKIDVCISNDLSSGLNDYQHVQKQSRYNQYLQWKEGKVPSFTFGDVHLLIRKNALAFIGLYNTGFVMMDWEYSLRISYLKANIVYYTGFNALTVGHPDSVTSNRVMELVTIQGIKGQVMYDYSGDKAEISVWSKIKIFIGKRIYAHRSKAEANEKTGLKDIIIPYDFLYNYIDQLAKTEKGVFI